MLLAPVALVLPSLLSQAPLPSPEPPTHPSPSAPALPMRKLMSIGDSITFGTDGSVTASYRGEVSRILRLTGQPHEWIVQAAPGSKCSWWTSRIDGLITTYHPDMIFLNCGTNDTPADQTEADYWSILTIAGARGVPVVASLIGRPDMRSPTNTVRPWIKDWMQGTREALQRALSGFPGVPYADVGLVPANPEWLQPDGIHWSARMEAAVGQLFYEAARLLWVGWKTLAQLGVIKMCGLSGVGDTGPWLRPGIDYRVCGD